MKKLAVATVVAMVLALASSFVASAQSPVVITLEQALEIGLSENVSVKVADMEIERTGFAKKGSYSLLVNCNLYTILKTDLTACDDNSTVCKSLEDLILGTHAASENNLLVCNSVVRIEDVYESLA